MSISLILKPGGILVEKRWVYNEKIKKGNYYEHTLISIDNESYLLSLLNTTIELAEGFTVRDWFNLIINYSAYQKLDLFIPSFLEEYYNCPKKDCVDPEGKLQDIIFQKTISYENYYPDKEDIYECEIYIDICGRHKDDDLHYAMEFTPLKEYLDTPIKLLDGITTKTSSILKENKESKKKKAHSDYTYDYKVENVKVYYTLFEFITSFIYEISFFGTPKKRDKKSKELMNTMEDIKSGKAKTIPLDLDKMIDDNELELETK